MWLKILALAFVALVFLGLGISGTFNAAFAGYDKIEQNPTVKQMQDKVWAIENAMQKQFGEKIKSELAGNNQ